MISTSDIILELIHQNGYENLNQFAVKNKINAHNLRTYYRNNLWGRYVLKTIGDILKVDLVSLATVD